MECLDANVVQDLMAGALEAGARTEVLGHLDSCEDCRELLSIAASDSIRESLPRFHDEPALAATTVPSGRDIGLLATQVPVDGGVGVAPTLAPGAAAGPDAAPPAHGRRLGRYTLLERLGAGAMGVVWRAEDPKLGRNVAVKVLRRRDEALTERLVREARSMAQVNDPNVVTVYEVGEADDGTMFIAMELVSGQSLRAWQRSARHTIPELVEAYIAAGRGLAAAHAAGIVHRDFKPDNVLVGDDGRVRVTDFGLAATKAAPDRGTPSPIGDVNLTTSGTVLGTPAYMAPEQFVGGNVDPRTDQFNFCVALYEALYGERPFDGATFAELGDNVCEGRIRPAPPGTQVSRALRAIVLAGLAVKPGDRFATMRDLIVELGRDRARPWRRAAIGSALVAGALALGLVADWAVRERIAGEIRQSFALTGTQLDKAVSRLTAAFNTASAIADREPALREVAAHHDQADFGLGTPQADEADLEKLHNTLVATDFVRPGHSALVIADYKGRLLYTSAAPAEWKTDLKVLPPVKRALDAGQGDSVTVVPYADPALVATRVFGAGPPRPGLAVLFLRAVAVGDKTTEQSEARAIYLMLQDGAQLLDDVRLDDQTRLALVAPGGAAIADPGMPAAALAAAPRDGAIADLEADGLVYQVQARPVRDRDATIAHVVMARPLDGVLSLFPGARAVFALTALAALALGLGTYARARQIAGARA